MKGIIVRDKTPQDCWTGPKLAIGDTVYRYDGPDYGCLYGGVAVTIEDGVTPFFEVPHDAVHFTHPVN